MPPVSELEDRINSILNSPEEMNRLMQTAQSLLGGETPPEGGGRDGGLPSLDPGMLSKLAGLFGGGVPPVQNAKSDKLALIEAMSPFLGEKRRRKMSRALQIAKAARIAGVFFAENGGEGDL